MIDHVILPTLVRFYDYLTSGIDISQPYTWFDFEKSELWDMVPLVLFFMSIVLPLTAFYLDRKRSAKRTEEGNGANKLKSVTYVNKETQTDDR